MKHRREIVIRLGSKRYAIDITTSALNGAEEVEIGMAEVVSGNHISFSNRTSQFEPSNPQVGRYSAT